MSYKTHINSCIDNDTLDLWHCRNYATTKAELIIISDCELTLTACRKSNSKMYSIFLNESL